MTSIIQIVISGSDRSGPAFASAATNLARLTQGSAPAVTGLARVETQAHQTGAAILTVGIAGSTTNTRMRSLGVTILNQEDRLELLALQLRETSAAYAAGSVQVMRADNAYKALNRTLENNRARMRDLETSGDVTGISVVGVGGGAAAAAGGLMGPGGLQTAAAGLGLALGAREMVQFSGAAIGAANDLEKVQATVRALAGTQEAYNDVLTLARRNQELYGGTTEETLQALGGLIPLTKSLNVEIGTLDQATRLLAASNTAEGIEGAAFAMREFLTATGAEGAVSIADRFNLIKSNITQIIASTPDATERTRLLTQELAKMGITEQLLTEQTQTRAAAYDRMWSAVDRAQTALGGAMGDVLLPYVQGVTGLLQIFTGDVAGGYASLQQAAPGIVQAGAQPFATQAMYSTIGDRTGPTVVNNITVQGSLVTERQVAATIRKDAAQTAARNGIRRPAGSSR